MVFYLCFIFITTYTADHKKNDLEDSETSLLTESIKVRPHFSSRRLLTPGQRKRLAEHVYIIESTVEPSKKAVRSSPKMEKLQKIQIKFDLRPLLAYDEKTETFRMIKDESELQENESLHPCSPRLTEEDIRKKYNILD
jgi:hypothetical protein